MTFALVLQVRLLGNTVDPEIFVAKIICRSGVYLQNKFLQFQVFINSLGLCLIFLWL